MVAHAFHVLFCVVFQNFYAILQKFRTLINQIKSFISDNTVHEKNKRQDTERQRVVQINT